MFRFYAKAVLAKINDFSISEISSAEITVNR